MDGLADELAEYGVKTVYAVEDAALEHYVADAYAQALAKLAQGKGCDIVIGTASCGRQGSCCRASRCGLQAGIASEITGINDDGTFERPMYAGNAMATISVETPAKVVSVRTTAFEPAAKGGKGEVEKVAAQIDAAALQA